MINRACISINNQCNLNCTYCHFHAPEKTAHLTESEMDIYAVLDNIMNHIDKHEIKVFRRQDSRLHHNQRDACYKKNA